MCSGCISNPCRLLNFLSTRKVKRRKTSRRTSDWDTSSIGYHLETRWPVGFILFYFFFYYYYFVLTVHKVAIFFSVCFYFLLSWLECLMTGIERSGRKKWVCFTCHNQLIYTVLIRWVGWGRGKGPSKLLGSFCWTSKEAKGEERITTGIIFFFTLTNQRRKEKEDQWDIFDGDGGALGGRKEMIK